jgi:hypothetical protein
MPVQNRGGEFDARMEGNVQGLAGSEAKGAYLAWFTADWIILRSSAASKGLYRKSRAPSSIAFCRISSLWRADIRITGNAGRSRLMRRWSSIPSIPGIRTSLMTQVATASVPEPRNSSADENNTGAYPADANKLSMDSRTRKSSSTAATTGMSGFAIERTG